MKPLFFSQKKLEAFSQGNPERILKLLVNWYNYKTKHIGLPNNIGGSSFLLNPRAILASRSKDELNTRVQYIRLAALRNYPDYELFGHKFLDSSLYPEIRVDLIKHNPLLKLNSNKIYFKYEELN